jgi:16S rRNA (cytidine1402-2'-O)-methyltransferase
MNDSHQRSQGGGRSKRHGDTAAPEGALEAGLYVVATPIGNASDISLRALRVLAGAQVVACEDTRTTGKLLAIHGIKARLTAYHEHNAERARPALLARLGRGAAVALVSDAGTPLISDPGYKLVAEARDAGFTVTPVPGASSPIAALSIAGLPTDRFMFAGFLPNRGGPRKRAIEDLALIPATLVLLESPRRLAACLDDLAAVLGPRQAAVTRELTKRFEEVRRGGLYDLAAHYNETGPPRGEIVMVIAPPDTAGDADLDPAAIDALLRRALETLSLRDAAASVAADTGLPRRQLYNRALELKSNL